MIVKAGLCTRLHFAEEIKECAAEKVHIPPVWFLSNSGCRLHLGLNRMSQKMRFFGPKVRGPSLAVKEAKLKLAREQRRRDVCNARLQELEKELQIFSEEFGSRLHDLRVSMKDMIHAAPNLRALAGSTYPDEAKSEEMEFNGHGI